MKFPYPEYCYSDTGRCGGTYDFILLIEVKKKTVSPLFFVKSENFHGISVYFALLT
jgi:hypothetical protein